MPLKSALPSAQVLQGQAALAEQAREQELLLNVKRGQLALAELNRFKAAKRREKDQERASRKKRQAATAAAGGAVAGAALGPALLGGLGATATPIGTAVAAGGGSLPVLGFGAIPAAALPGAAGAAGLGSLGASIVGSSIGGQLGSALAGGPANPNGISNSLSLAGGIIRQNQEDANLDSILNSLKLGKQTPESQNLQLTLEKLKELLRSGV